jgi:hypothetical protein
LNSVLVLWQLWRQQSQITATANAAIAANGEFREELSFSSFWRSRRSSVGENSEICRRRCRRNKSF